MLLLQVQQEPLARQPSGIAGQAPVLPDDPVAGDDHAQRIAPDGRADILGQHVLAEPAGKLTVTGGPAVRDAADKASDTPLEPVTPRIDHKIERFSLPGEVLGQLPGDLAEPGVSAEAENRRVRPVPVMPEIHASQATAIPRQCQVPQRRADHSMSSNHDFPLGTARPKMQKGSRSASTPALGVDH